MVLDLLVRLRADGWDLSEPGHLSQAWRQHDLALVGRDGEPLIPALSWQCNLAGAQAEALNRTPASGMRSARSRRDSSPPSSPGP